MQRTLTVALATLVASGCRDLSSPAAPLIRPVSQFASASVESNDIGTLNQGYCSARAINGAGTVAGHVYQPNGVFRGFVWSPGGAMLPLALGSGSSQSSDVNEKGQVVGGGQVPTGQYHGFVWTAKGLIDVGVLPGGDPARLGSNLIAINDDGRAAGWASDPVTGRAHAVIWEQEAGLTDISGSMTGATGYAQAIQINARGNAVGSYRSSELAPQRPFIWLDGRIRDIGTLGGPSGDAFAINAANQVIGTSETAALERHAFIWDVTHGMRDLGTLGGRNSYATAINDAGDVAGQVEMPGGSYHAFLWTESGGMVDLGGAQGSSAAIAINDARQLAGYSTLSGGVVRATAWNGGKPDIRLPSLTGLNSVAHTINGHGQVAGTSSVGSFESHCVVWTVPLGVVNQDPVAVIGGPYSGIVGTAVQFDATASSDPDGDALTFNWDFGDGSASNNLGPTPAHAYGAAGSFTATVTVDDGNGGTNSASATVTVLSPADAAGALGGAVEALTSGGAIPPTLAGPLVSSADAAAASLAKGNNTAASGQLNAFINKVEAAVASGRVSPADGADLIAFARKVLQSIAG